MVFGGFLGYDKEMKILFLLSILVLILPSPVLAYLDPGSGSFIFQFLIAGGLGALFLAKTYWRKIKAFLGRLFSKRGDEN
jgi:hypothetical protein